MVYLRRLLLITDQLSPVLTLRHSWTKMVLSTFAQCHIIPPLMAWQRGQCRHFKQSLRQIPEGSVKEKLAKFLFIYRITPHSSTGVAPAELLMGRRLRSRLDLLRPDLSATVQNNQLRQKLYHDSDKPYRTFTEGEAVYVEDFTTAKQKWIPGTIQNTSGPLSYIIVLLDGTTVKRHIDSIKARHVNPDTTTLLEEDETFQIGPELTSSVSSTDLPDHPMSTATSSEIVTSSRPVRT